MTGLILSAFMIKSSHLIYTQSKIRKKVIFLNIITYYISKSTCKNDKLIEMIKVVNFK